MLHQKVVTIHNTQSKHLNFNIRSIRNSLIDNNNQHIYMTNIICHHNLHCKICHLLSHHILYCLSIDIYSHFPHSSNILLPRKSNYYLNNSLSYHKINIISNFHHLYKNYYHIKYTTLYLVNNKMKMNSFKIQFQFLILN